MFCVLILTCLIQIMWVEVKVGLSKAHARYQQLCQSNGLVNRKPASKATDTGLNYGSVQPRVFLLTRSVVEPSFLA